jgi:hypothetical protein
MPSQGKTAGDCNRKTMLACELRPIQTQHLEAPQLIHLERVVITNKP